MNKENMPQVSFDQVKYADLSKTRYRDDGIAIFTNIWRLPINEIPIKLDMFVLTACVKGKIQVEQNAITFTVHPKEILIGKPNDIISNCMASPDFDGIMVFLSQQFFFEQISESDVWENTFQFQKSPIIKVNEESLKSYILYEEILQKVIKQEQKPFRKEIIGAIVRASLYEMLSNAVTIEQEVPKLKLRLDRAGDSLFKRFIELLAKSQVKSRSVAWYAENLCVTPKYLSTICKQVMGKTATHWINEYVKIDIRHWLKNSNKSIKEIADLLDFPNTSFFGKYCRRHFGMSPVALRIKLREKLDKEP